MAKKLNRLDIKHYRTLLLATDELSRDEVMKLSLDELKEYAEEINASRKLSDAIALVEAHGGVITFPKRSRFL